MERAHGFAAEGQDGHRAARIVGVSIAILFGLICVLHAISA
jgi:hypothetical protein